MNKEKLLIVLCGKICSGRASILREIIKRNDIKPLISHTDRPMREGEVNGKDYYFLNSYRFNELIFDNSYVEVRTYNTRNGLWRYGLCKKELEDDYKVGVVILDLKGLEEIEEYCKDTNIKVVSIYIDVDGETRLKRALDRQSPTTEEERIEICRRYMADHNDFENAEEYCDYTVYNGSELMEAVMIVEEIINKEYEDMIIEPKKKEELKELDDNIEGIEFTLEETITELYYSPDLVFDRVGDKNFKIFRDHYGNLMFNISGSTEYTGQLPIFNYMQDLFIKSKTKREELL